MLKEKSIVLIVITKSLEVDGLRLATEMLGDQER